MIAETRQITAESSRLGVELDSLLATLLEARWPAAESARRIWRRDDLPGVLAQYTQRLLPGEHWRAYTDGVRLWFVTAHEAASFATRWDAPAYELRFFENDGTLCASGIWQHSSNLEWQFVQSDRQDRRSPPAYDWEDVRHTG